MGMLHALLTAGIALSGGNSGSSLTKLGWTTKKSLKGGAAAGLKGSTYRGGNYCGPGWGFTYKDILDGTIAKLPDAIDAIDEACKSHDYCYEENGYLTQGCNLVLSYDLVKVVVDEQSSAQQRLDAVVMAVVFFVESQTFDLGKLATDEAVAIKNRVLASLSRGTQTVSFEIKREMRLRGVLMP